MESGDDEPVVLDIWDALIVAIALLGTVGAIVAAWQWLRAVSS